MVISRDLQEFLKKSMKASGKSEKETLKNKIVQEIIKEYSIGGCNYKRGKEWIADEK